MSVSRALRRLLRVLEIEEEQRRIRLESGLSDLGRLKNALAATDDLDRRGRRLVSESACTGELPNRLAGIAETRAAERVANLLTPRVAEAESAVTGLRQEYLAKRVERRQAQTLVEKAEAEDALEAERRSQQMLDERFLSRFWRLGSAAKERTSRPEDCDPDAGIA